MPTRHVRRPDDSPRAESMTDAADEHVSPLRQLMAEATGDAYLAFESLEEARADPHGAVILEGDDGGQIYTVAPAGVVSCAEDALDELLCDLDTICWPHNDWDSARVVFERRAVGAPVAGGMGGGIVTRQAWIHPALVQLELGQEIRDVLSGELDRLSSESRAKRQP
jgi:hypothetical protein